MSMEDILISSAQTFEFETRGRKKDIGLALKLRKTSADKKSKSILQ